MEENKAGQEELTGETIPSPQPEEAPEEVLEQTEEVTEETEETEEVEEAEEAEEAEDEESDDEGDEEGEEPAEEAPAKSKSKTVLAALLVVIVLAVLFVLVLMGARKEDVAAQNAVDATVGTVPADGNPDDVTCKGTYTDSDEAVLAAADTVVATIGDAQLTNGQLQILYWSMVNNFLNTQNGYMMMAYGLLDYTQPLDTQLYDGTMTWQQCFLDMALNQWQMYQALLEAAQSEGLEMSQEDKENLETLPQQLDTIAQSQGKANAQELIAWRFGTAGTLENYTWYQQLYLQGYPYYQAKTEAMDPTLEEIEAFYQENAQTYADNGLDTQGKYVDVRHILLSVEGGTTDESGTTTYSDEEWEACRVRAQEILDAWLAGEMTEESFAALAAEHSQDPGSSANGGLYEDVYQGRMVEPFDTWCFDETRAPGDYGLVQTSYGYHVMYYVDSTPIWQVQARTDLISQMTTQLLEDLIASAPITVDYSAIKLGYVNLAE